MYILMRVQRFGRGVKAAADGSTYDGEWVNDRMEGRGTIRWSNGSSYSGTWVSGTVRLFVACDLDINLCVFIATLRIWIGLLLSSLCFERVQF